ncbi:autotransporter outer membrane beta-barrel domain-containing protein [Paraburkholderia bryophila]|uniref:autotransporter family protein n=1 Tax=Paraburkholderia bryophila TaxID=420952 RepID=UPI00234B5198|nr:autotransporter outer membrane beta-barrel domain-containing protein [Paraburkholderia bryophila]WCM22495.1 autotransporter outer membrane beta-barrel domain-containing protein [Paraburkholderia bryophila]
MSVNNSNIGTAGSINVVGVGPATGLNALTGISLTGSSSAGNASISATGLGLSRFLDAIVAFHDTSTAANATLTTGGQAQFTFFDTSSAGHATINNNAGGLTAFQGQASAGGAHIANNAGALTVFVGSATADNATIVNNAGGVVDLSLITSAIGIGSLSGSGNVYLGGARLTLGNLGQNDVIGGVVTDGASPDLAAYAAQGGLILSSPAGGSLAKVGTGTLTLTGQNTYTGGTSFDGGVVQIGADANLGASTGTLTFDGGALSATADIAMNRATTINAGGGTIDTAAGTQLTQGGVIGGSGMLTKAGGGTMLLNAANTYTGGTTVVSGTLVVGDAAHGNATIGSGATTVSPGTTLGGYGSALGSVNNGGTIEVANALPAFASGNTGSFSIAGDLNNSGLANVAAASGQIGNVLNVGGNYAGSNGQLALNTLLNEGGAATHSDQLVVGGNASGQTAIKVNGSGTGAYTPGDGILLVQVNGTSAAGSFHLAGPVQGGAYQYLLYQGSASSANDWYLRSQLEAQPAPATPPETVPPSIPTPAQPAYRPGVVGYSLTPLLNVDYGYSILGRLHERAGDIVNLESAQPGNSNGIWGRIGGENVDANAGNRFSTNANTFFAQFGKDWTLLRNANGASTHAGAMLTFGSMSASFDDSLRSINGQLTNPTGTVQTQAQSIGGYWTKYRADGAYFDGVGQLTHYGNRYGDVYGDSASQNGFGAGVSGEIGKPYLIGSTRIAVEPQAQLLYQYVHLNSIDDNISAIGSTSTNALRGRLGARIFTANLSNETKTSSATPYLSVNVLHDFLSPGQTAVGGTPFASQFGKTWWDVGVGVTGSMGKHSELYVNVKYARAIGSYYGRAVFGQGGYRYSW